MNHKQDQERWDERHEVLALLESVMLQIKTKVNELKSRDRKHVAPSHSVPIDEPEFTSEYIIVEQGQPAMLDHPPGEVP